MSSFRWTDWTTDTSFRIRVSMAAADKLDQLAPETQDRLRRMMQDIAELADLMPSENRNRWNDSASPLLQLQMGRVTVRYSIDEEARTLTIQHVIVPEVLEDVG